MSSPILDSYWISAVPGLASENSYFFVDCYRVWNWNQNLFCGSSELHRSCRTISDRLLFMCSHGQNLVKRSNGEG